MIKIFSLFLGLTLLNSVGFAEKAATPAAKKVCSKTNGTDLPFLKGHNFLIKDYDEDTKTYEIMSPEFPGEEPSFVTLEALSGSNSKIKKDAEAIRKHPEDIISETYMAESDIPTLFDEERDARKGCPNQ